VEASQHNVLGKLKVPNIFAIVTDVSGKRAYPWV